jgi:hypothetical protein
MIYTHVLDRGERSRMEPSGCAGPGDEPVAAITNYAGAYNTLLGAKENVDKWLKQPKNPASIYQVFWLTMLVSTFNGWATKERVMRDPEWKSVAAEVAPVVLSLTDRELSQNESGNPDANLIPHLATCHLNLCLNASFEANAAFQPSVAICLLRQCVEALTVIDVGFQDLSLRDPLLEEWRTGKSTTGALRKRLEETVWPRYGVGLWDESWTEFFSNLAKAVHPYAHYSPELLGWQQSIVAFDGGSRFLVATGPRGQDPVKASRLALLQSLVIWALARLLLANRAAPTSNR